MGNNFSPSIPPKPVKSIKVQFITENPAALREAFIRRGWLVKKNGDVERIATAGDIGKDVREAVEEVRRRARKKK